MTHSAATTRRVVIIGGGVAGLGAAVRLVQAGLPVTLFESSELGGEASTRNQGWLHSGALFATEHPDYARVCHAALQQTLQFCPECLEPQVPNMVYLFSRGETLVRRWTDAWNATGIPWKEIELERVFAELPGVDRSRVQHAFQLPDRVVRPDLLLTQLAAAARNAGVEIRCGTHVKCLNRREQRIESVTASAGDEVAARLVIVAGGVSGLDMCREFLEPCAGSQGEVELVPLRTHLVSLEPEVGRLPFCVPDAGGFNHVPHPPASVFGTEHWERARTTAGETESQEVERVCGMIREFFPELAASGGAVRSWAGVIVQPLRVDQIQLGGALWPAVIDHARQAPCISNLISIFPGRASLWPNLAEETRRVVLGKLDVPEVGVAQPPWVGVGGSDRSTLLR